MEKTARAELIAALVTDKFSGFKDGDEAILEAASDERLEAFRAAADAGRSAAVSHTRLETDHRNTTARLKVAEDRLKASEAEMTEEEFIARAPASIKKTLQALAAEEAEVKAALVNGLKDLGAHTDEELKKMTIPELKTLAKYAKVHVMDYSGRGLPKDRFAESNETASYAPPDPYAEAIKARQDTKH